VGGQPEIKTFFDQYDVWLSRLVAAFAAADNAS
jgi:hypothetical protein